MLAHLLPLMAADVADVDIVDVDVDCWSYELLLLFLLLLMMMHSKMTKQLKNN